MEINKFSSKRGILRYFGVRNGLALLILQQRGIWCVIWKRVLSHWCKAVLM